MRSVTKGFPGAGLATTPNNFLFFLDLNKDRPHARGTVGAVAKWLLLGFAAAAPHITSRLDGHDVGMIIFAHWLIVFTGVSVITLMGWPKLSTWPMNSHLLTLLS